MAISTNLPIYKVAYDLFSVVTDLIKNMPRDFKQSIGSKTGHGWPMPYVIVAIASNPI